VSQFRQDWRKAGTVTVTHFGTLASLTQNDKNKNVPAALTRLCSVVPGGHRERERLLAAYDLLARAIRNRDAHAYVPNVRDSHHNLVPQLFTACFNVLASWLPHGATTAKMWQAEAKDFIASL
jgi:hypothetical protein